MFSPVPMMRMNAVILERDERKVLETLGQLGVLQLTRSQADSKTSGLVIRDASNELAQCRRLLARLHELRGALAIKNCSPTVTMPKQGTLAQWEQELEPMEKAVQDQLQRRQQLQVRLNEVRNASSCFADYQGLEIPLDQPDAASFLHFVTGTLPPENVSIFQTELAGKGALLTLPERQGRQPLIALTTRENRPALEQELQRAGFQRELLPVIPGATLDAIATEQREEETLLATQLKQLETDLEALAIQYARPLAELEFALRTEEKLLEAGENFSRTARAFLINGWVPSMATRDLEVRIQEITSGRCLLELATPEDPFDDRIPVLLRQPPWLRPFARLVSAFGLPRYCELEPTLFFAISYVLMFGMMFGDVGHGTIFAIAGLVAMNRRYSSKVRQGGRLFVVAGLSSLFFGLLYGSYFGLPSLKSWALWSDPLEGNPIHLMLATIGFGCIMITLGLILNLFNRWRHRDFFGGVLGRFGLAGIIFYWGCLGLLTQSALLKTHGLLFPAITLFLAAPVGCWVLAEPLQKLWARRKSQSASPGGVFATLAEALVSAFEAGLSYFANTLSFVRLAAYAMSHAALLLAAFVMADAVKHIAPGGGLLALLVIFLGNALAMLLEGVVASVQALRLEYYEFFGKFFTGGGEAFKPFRLPASTAAATPL